MHTENANSQLTSQVLSCPDFIASITAVLMPAINTVLDQALEKAAALANSPTMSKENFCAANGISSSLLEKWIANGVVLLAPTPTTKVTRTSTCKKTGVTRTNVMEKHGNALINVAAWREKNRQHAVNCRYIKR
jgi:hypothetical protein